MKDVDWSPLLIRMSKGDEEDFRTIYELTRDHAYRLIYYLGANKDEIDDIMSEIYIQFVRSADNFRSDQSFISWFNGLVIRQVRNWKRKKWRVYRIVEKVKLLAPVSLDRAAESRFAEVGDQMELIAMLNKLPQKSREIIVLRYYQDCTLEEISELLNIPLGTVKSRHHYALKQLRRQFDAIPNQEERKNYVY